MWQTGEWCWIERQYPLARLLFFYLWTFVSFGCILFFAIRVACFVRTGMNTSVRQSAAGLQRSKVPLSLVTFLVTSLVTSLVTCVHLALVTSLWSPLTPVPSTGAKDTALSSAGALPNRLCAVLGARHGRPLCGGL